MVSSGFPTAFYAFPMCSYDFPMFCSVALLCFAAFPSELLGVLRAVLRAVSGLLVTVSERRWTLVSWGFLGRLGVVFRFLGSALSEPSYMFLATLVSIGNLDLMI